MRLRVLKKADRSQSRMGSIMTRNPVRPSKHLTVTRSLVPLRIPITAFKIGYNRYSETQRPSYKVLMLDLFIKDREPTGILTSIVKLHALQSL